jgi:hypothetical protein
MVNKVSFICTTYRRFRCVQRIVAQYHAQSYKNKELIIFNTDEEFPYVLGFEDDSIIVINNGIDYVTNEKYTNRGDICRDAITHATGYYFMLADDDDIYLPFHIEQAVDGIISNGKDCWKPKQSFFATGGNIELSQNVMEASVIVKMERIREIGFRNDMTGYEGMQWYDKLKSEGHLDEDNLIFIPSYSFNWGDPPEIGGQKQSSDIDNPDNFDNHKLKTKDIVTGPLYPYNDKQLYNTYAPYYEWLVMHIPSYIPELVYKYLTNNDYFIKYSNMPTLSIEYAVIVIDTNKGIKKLTIYSAYYDTKNVYNELVMYLMNNSCTSLMVSNGIFGDPSYGRVKSLTVNYSMDNVNYTKTAVENTLFTFI